MTESSSPVVRSRPRRARYIIAGLVCLAIVGGLLWFGLSRNIVYYRTVSEAVDARATTGNARFRLAGAVVPGSIVQTGDGVRFEVTDGKATTSVLHRGDPPELFKDGAPVVCEGVWGRGTEFSSDRIMIKHGNEYTPPTVSFSGNAP